MTKPDFKPQVMKIHLEMDKKRDKLPPVIMYKDYLKRIVNKENITIDEARKKYGQYTINQWNKLLNNG